MLSVAIDVDGTYTRYPDFFTAMARGLQSQGARVGILTARVEKSSKASDMRRFHENGWTPDFYYGRDAFDTDIDPVTWKGQQMKAYRIDFLFDDFLSNTVKLLWRQDLTRGAPEYGQSTTVKNKKNKKVKPDYSGAKTPDSY